MGNSNLEQPVAPPFRNDELSGEGPEIVGAERLLLDHIHLRIV